MNLKSPSTKPFEKSRNRSNDLTMKTKSSGSIGQQKNLKSIILNTINFHIIILIEFQIIYL